MTSPLADLLPVLLALAVAGLLAWQLDRTHRRTTSPVSRHHHGLDLWSTDAQERRRAIR